MSDNPNITHVTDATFEEEVLNYEGYVFVDFWAEWCGPCKMLEPEVEKLADEYAGKLKVVKMDVDANPQVPGKYQVFSIPTMMLVTPERNDEGKRRSLFTVGFRPKPALEKWMKDSGFNPDEIQASTSDEADSEAESTDNSDDQTAEAA